MLGVKQLEIIKTIQENWVMAGTRPELCSVPNIHHNTSNTVSVDNWDEVFEYIWENRQIFTGISLLADDSTIYNQSPFTEVLMPEEIIERYGDGGLLASGLIVDGLERFDNLWNACNYLNYPDTKLVGTASQLVLQRDWIRRAKQFSRRYFKNNIDEMINCLKYVHLYHKWGNVNRVLKNKQINILEDADLKPTYIEIDQTSGQACASGICDITH